MLKAVIFDFDGVVGDTMKDNCVAWEKSLLSFGIKIEPLEYYLLEGMGRFQIARYFINKYKIDPFKENEIVFRKEESYIQNNKFKIYPDIFAIFSYLNKHCINKALVTGASNSRLNKSLDNDLLSEFSVVITADDVVNSKPDPEPYNKALERLGLSPISCIVVENAKLGIQSAKSAGIKCFAIETTLDKTFLSEADEIFSSHEMILNKFKEIF